MIDFKVGKWYKFKADDVFAIKCLNLVVTDFEYSEFINLNQKKYNKTATCRLSKENYGWEGSEVPITEIFDFLPEDHEDRPIINPKKADYIQLLKLLKEYI